VEWSGVGIHLKTNQPTPRQIKDAVKKIRFSSHYGQKAQHFQAEIARYDAPTLFRYAVRTTGSNKTACA
jgi:UDP:flavonoid glycosyltransferase YjiC (YdhE family)